MGKGHVQYYIVILKRYYYAIGISLLMLQSLVLENFLGKIPSENIFVFLISGAFYLGVFRVAITLFEWKGWLYFMKPEQLSGKWYITFAGTRVDEVTNTKGVTRERTKNYIRYGHTYVDWESPIDISITGSNYNDDGTEASVWTGIVVYLKNNEIKYTYTINRQGRGLHTKDGVYIGTVNRDVDGNIVVIEGGYKDDFENNYGVTTWTRLPPPGHPEFKE